MRPLCGIQHGGNRKEHFCRRQSKCDYASFPDLGQRPNRFPNEGGFCLDTKKEVSLKKRLVTLFFSMLSISTFTFGGGFVIVTLMKRRFVDDLHWLDEDEMLDMTAIAQSCPGAIAVNGAILVGQRVAGAAGIIVATVATIIPPMVILSLVSYFYALFADNPYVAAVLAGMQAGVAAVIVDVVLNLGTGVIKTKRWLLDIIMVAAFAAAISGVNVIYIILTSGVIGVICAIAGRGKKAHAA